MNIDIFKLTTFVKYSLILLFCTCYFVTLKAQYSKVSKDVIINKRISSMRGVINVNTPSGGVEEIPINEYEFDTEGRCVRKMIITPFIDVTSRANEYYFTYDSLDNVTKETRISKSVGLTPQGKGYISNFGNNEDTIIRKFYYVDNKLLREIKIKKGKRDSTQISYLYDGDSIIIKTNIKFSKQGILSPGNYVVRCFYDDYKRLIREERQPLESNHISIKVITYEGKSERKKSEEVKGAYGWSYYRDENGARDYKVVSKPEVRYTEYTYDENNILMMKRIYPDRADTKKYYDLDKNNKRILSATSNEDEDGVFMRIYNELELVYNDNGLLDYEKRYKSNGEVMYICNYTYKYH